MTTGNILFFYCFVEGPCKIDAAKYFIKPTFMHMIIIVMIIKIQLII